MKNLRTAYGEWALVTGASQGIGRAFCDELAKQGMNIVLVARNEVALTQAAAHIENTHQIHTRVVATDLSNEQGLTALFEATQDLNIGLVIPNAGVEISGPFLQDAAVDHKKLIDINISSPLALAHHYGSKMAADRKGGILLVSSLFGYQGVPYFATYSATKSFILTLGESLAEEFKHYGIDVSVVSPGFTKTQMTDNLNMDVKKMPIMAQSPHQVAKAGLHALGRKPTLVSGLLNKVYAWENRLLPRSWPVKVFGILIKRAAKRPIKMELKQHEAN